MNNLAQTIEQTAGDANLKILLNTLLAKENDFEDKQRIEFIRSKLQEYDKGTLTKPNENYTSLNNSQYLNNSLPYEQKNKEINATETLNKLIGNTAIFGHTNSGKTNFVMKCLYFDKFDDYDMFIYVKHTSAAQVTNNVEQIREAAISDLILNKNKDPEEANENFLFFRDYQVEASIQFCESEQAKSKKKIIFFDDIQVGSDASGSKKNMALITNFMGRCKHANTEVILAIHKNFDDTKDTRGEANNIVALNLSERDFNTLFGLKSGNVYWRTVLMKEGKYSKGAIYTSGDQKYYDQNFKTLVPLLPNIE
ncbi:MAG: hypothetical protein WCJ33_06095 [Pseudomonadota bacterium]